LGRVRRMTSAPSVSHAAVDQSCGAQEASAASKTAAAPRVEDIVMVAASSAAIWTQLAVCAVVGMVFVKLSMCKVRCGTRVSRRAS